MSSIRWHTDPTKCPHYNDDVCPTCDFDKYYAFSYEDCPWRDAIQDAWNASEGNL